MLYQQSSFTVPASSPATKQKDWDRAFLSEEEFSKKWSHQLVEFTVLEPNTPISSTELV